MSSAIIVSAYYKIPNKFSHSFYTEHLLRFFKALQGKAIMFFCDTNVLAEIKTLPVDTSAVNFQVLPWNELPLLKTFPRQIWDQNKRVDFETYHTPELGIIWNSKKEFLKLAKNIFPADWYVWLDAGCIRTDNWNPICEKFLTRRLSTLTPGVYFSMLNKPPLNKFFWYKPGVYYIAGGLHAIHRDYIDRYSDLYDEMIKKYLEYKISITSDQYIMASLFNSGHEWIRSFNWWALSAQEQKECPDKWMFMLRWL